MDNEEELVNQRISEEVEMANDLVIAPFVDNYENLSQKTYYAYQV